MTNEEDANDGQSWPTGLEMYQALITGEGGGGGGGGGGGADSGSDDSTEVGRPFNHRFEDIKELHHDDEVPLIVRTENQLQRTRGTKSKRRFGEFSLLLRRIIDLDRPSKPRLQLEIQSDLLQTEFRKLAGRMTSISLSHDPIVIPEPYQELYHLRDKIRDAVHDAPSDDIRQELRLLVDFQKKYMADTLDAIHASKESGSIEFEWLWSLFPPGELVVVQNTSACATAIEWCASLKSYRVLRDPVNGSSWQITVAHTGFNGQSFGSVHSSFTFPAFSGIISITQLPVYPLEFCTHKDQLRQDAIARGASYEQYCIASAKSSLPPIGTPRTYEGPFWTKRDEYNEDSPRGCQIHDSPSHTISGRVILDVEGFLSEHPGLRDTLVPESTEDTGPDEADEVASIDLYLLRRRHRQKTDLSALEFAAQLPRKPLSSEQHLTCPPFIPAFSFAKHAWGLVLIDELRNIEWNANVFNKLQLDSGVKNTLRGLVRGHSTHSTHSTGFDDFIQGKGRGLVFLLRGPPGCGKTMTAESIAESLERPLFSVSGGELGTSARDIQVALARAFWMASRWQAIFLLDEADAFLAQRRGDSVERNALISVFLRLLEYQSGIIFLTTNRFTDFDEAFHSRIHISIQFDGLGPAQRTLIWRDLASERCACALSDAEAAALGSLPIDGRTIKNVLRLASLFAKTRDDEADMLFSDIVAVLPLALGSGSSQRAAEATGTAVGEGTVSSALDRFMDAIRQTHPSTSAT